MLVCRKTIRRCQLSCELAHCDFTLIPMDLASRLTFTSVRQTANVSSGSPQFSWLGTAALQPTSCGELSDWFSNIDSI